MYLLINSSSILEKLSKLKKNNFFLKFKINQKFLNNAYKKKPQINGVSLKEKIKYCVKLRFKTVKKLLKNLVKYYNV